MFNLRISPRILEHRLDSGFYNPTGLKATELLEKNMMVLPLSALVDQSRTITNGVRGPDWENTKYKLIRLQDCENWQVNHQNAASISLLQFKENKRCKLNINDIVVAIGGYVGNAAVLTEDCYAVIGQHSAILPSPESQNIDSRFLLAYLNSRIAESIFNRYVSGTVQAGINLEDLRDLPAPVVDTTAQKYIGDKVRQAEQLRTSAKELESEIEQVLNTSEYLVACNTPDTKISHPTLNDLSNRLDPKYYDSKAIAVERFTKKSGTLLGSLIKSIANGFEERNFVNKGVPYITVTEVSSGRLNVQDAPQIGSDISIPSKAIIHERCVLVVRTGSIGTAIKVNTLDKGCVISSHLIRLEFEEEETAAAVSVFLNSTAGKILLHKISYGAVQPQIGQEELLALYIPDYVLNKKTTCLTLLENYELTTRASKSLIRTAKTLVEALIEGQLTEEQLIQAQQALDDGDNTLDKAILSKLSSEGYAVEGAAPLFSDIDELYRLLASANAADDSED